MWLYMLCFGEISHPYPIQPEPNLTQEGMPHQFEWSQLPNTVIIFCPPPPNPRAWSSLCSHILQMRFGLHIFTKCDHKKSNSHPNSIQPKTGQRCWASFVQRHLANMAIYTWPSLPNASGSYLTIPTFYMVQIFPIYNYVQILCRYK